VRRSYSQLALGQDWQRLAQRTAAGGERPTKTKNQVSYRPASGHKRCGNCVMFRLKAPDFETGGCTLVKGNIDEAYVCDEWYPEKGATKVGVSGSDPGPRSAFMYLDVPNHLINQVPGGEEDAHITIVYLGKGVSDQAFGHALQRAAEAAASHHPMEGVLHGIETFPASGGKTPAFIPAYVPGVGHLVRSLVDLSKSEHKHDYRPHVTLAYLEDGDPMPPPHPPVHLRFTHLHVKRGDQVVRFPLGNSKQHCIQEAAE
jgi:2'-5' RNA ligase